MSYFTTRQVLQAAAGRLNLSLGSLTESEVNLFFAREKRASTSPDFSATPPILWDIFLSHSSLDAKLVLGIYTLLTTRGYGVYLDSVCDPHLSRANVTKSTARILRYRMAQSRSMFVCTTNNTTRSQWVPWELGFSDGWKDGKAAILPIIDEAVFRGQEYFELYPEVKDAGSGHSKPNDLDVWDQGNYLGS